MLVYHEKNIVIPKQGNSEKECEDAFCSHDFKNYKIFCMSDGATESSFAKEWANILVNKSVKKNTKLSVDKFLKLMPSLQSEWKQSINTKDLPWYAEEKVSIGAFATFLCVSVNLKTGELIALSIGDCCMFVIREDKLVYQFPKDISFGNTPYLLSSNPQKNLYLKKYLTKSNQPFFKLEKNDLLYIMSDAIADFFVHQISKEKKPWYSIKNTFDRSCYQEDFTKWLSELRHIKELKNDDVAIAQIIFE